MTEIGKLLCPILSIGSVRSAVIKLRNSRLADNEHVVMEALLDTFWKSDFEFADIVSYCNMNRTRMTDLDTTKKDLLFLINSDLDFGNLSQRRNANI